jgi:hypothetical protein
MAYGNYIASVPLDEIDALRRNQTAFLRPTGLEIVSHLVGYWIPAQPIGQLLGQVLDGGELLADDLTHPLRPPKMHLPMDVARLRDAILEGVKTAIAAGQTKEIEWFRLDIEKINGILQLAVERGEAIVSVLEPPMDEERAAKVRIPFAVGSA